MKELAADGFSCAVFEDQDASSTTRRWTGIRPRMDRWLLSLPKPVGIMCFHDERALPVLVTCERLGMRVPDDVALVSVGNDELLCQLSNPPLSSVDMDWSGSDLRRRDCCTRCSMGAKPPSEAILIPPRRIVVRQSSDIIAIEDSNVAKALRFIRQHADEGINVKQVLGEVSISRKTLERHFADLIGRSPREEITRVRIDRAKSLLEETELSVPAIARRVGFKRQTDFFDVFPSRNRTDTDKLPEKTSHRLTAPIRTKDEQWNSRAGPHLRADTM